MVCIVRTVIGEPARGSKTKCSNIIRQYIVQSIKWIRRNRRAIKQKIAKTYTIQRNISFNKYNNNNKDSNNDSNKNNSNNQNRVSTAHLVRISWSISFFHLILCIFVRSFVEFVFFFFNSSFVQLYLNWTVRLRFMSYSFVITISY